MSKIIALFVADLHLSWNPPVARSAESNWLEAQAYPLRQLRELQEKHNCPVIVAGDIFDKHNPSPALINWAIQNLPIIWAVPGQHDLPLHSLVDIKKSAYWTLVEAKIIENLGVNKWRMLTDDEDGIMACGFSWGELIDFHPPTHWREEQGPLIAVAHSYVWTKGNQYTGASEDTYLTAYTDRLKGYDVAVFGDNHCGFDSAVRGGCEVYNCGCLIRRKRNEKKYKPAVGLLWDHGQVQRYFLDVSEDKWLEDEELPLGEVNERGLSEFIDGLGGLDAERVGFCDLVHRYVVDGKSSKGVGAIMLEALEDSDHG